MRSGWPPGEGWRVPDFWEAATDAAFPRYAPASRVNSPANADRSARARAVRRPRTAAARGGRGDRGWDHAWCSFFCPFIARRGADAHLRAYRTCDALVQFVRTL